MNFVGCTVAALIIAVLYDQCHASSRPAMKRGASGRLWRHIMNRIMKRKFHASPPRVSFDNNDGFYVLDLLLVSPFCFSSQSPCPSNTWVIDDLNFQLRNKLNPCHRDSLEFNTDKIPYSLGSSICEIWLGLQGVQETKINFKFHGSSCLEISELNDEFKFFNKSIDLFRRYNISKILERKNISFGGDYSINDISAAISETLEGKHAQLGCIRGYDFENSIRDEVDQFNEVIIFFDKQFNPINDPGWNKRIFKSCSKDVIVHYGIDRG